MKKVTVTGKSVEEAIKAGLQQLQTTEDRVTVTVLEQPSKGLFGLIGAKEAKVELEWIPDAADTAEQFLLDVFEAMSLNIEVEKKETDEGLQLTLQGQELGLLIGRRGQTLDALQYLVNIIANRQKDEHVRITLDAENFRERRKKTLEDLAYRLAGRVIKSRKEVVLEPMTPQERKIIHSNLQDHPKVRTFSKGDEPNRRVVIALK